MKILDSGLGEVKISDMDEVREWMRDKKSRSLEEKLMSEREAVKKFVHDGDYVSYDLCGLIRGPMALEREIVRQKKRNLWVAAKFTLLDTTILVMGKCVSKIDVGFAGVGRALYGAIERGEVETVDWSNGTLALRHLAGAMGIPFIPTRALLGTDTLKYSGAKVVEDPFTKKKIALIPAVNPDVALIHVNQADIYGNARIFGPTVAPLETAMASRRVILCAEEIIDIEEFRRHPQRTTIPYYLTDAVVEAPFASHPGTCPGLYRFDFDHLGELFKAESSEEGTEKYLEKYVYGVENHFEYLEVCGGFKKMHELKMDEKIREGYYEL